MSNKDLKIAQIKIRIALLESRDSDNGNIVKKLKRQLRTLQD